MNNIRYLNLTKLKGRVGWDPECLREAMPRSLTLGTADILVVGLSCAL